MSGAHDRAGERWTTGCPTGKRTYESKVAAKAARKQIRDGKGHLSIYTCDACGGIHLGRLPRAVIHGTDTRDNVRHYRRLGRETK